MQKSVKEVQQIEREVITILNKKSFFVTSLNNYNISRGMNSKIIAALIYYTSQYSTKKDGEVNILNLDYNTMLEIYNELSEKTEKEISEQSLLSLKLTLIRYSSIFSTQ